MPGIVQLHYFGNEEFVALQNGCSLRCRMGGLLTENVVFYGDGKV